MLDAVGTGIGLNQPILGTVREQAALKGEQDALWPKNPNLYPYTTFGIKSLER